MNVAWLFVLVIACLALAGVWVTPVQAALVFVVVYALGGTGLVK